MKRRRSTGSGELKPVDAELDARLSRLRSELAQAMQLTAQGERLDERLQEIQLRLEEVSTLEDHGQRVLAIHEVEAELCLLKPEVLLYPTWVRLRETLYRFDEGRRDAWKEDISSLISINGQIVQEETVRQRLRQLTLELQESASRYNRLNEERATVTRDVNRLAIWIISILLVLLVVCFMISTFEIPSWASTLMSLGSGVLSGGMGAVFSRLKSFRSERVRYEFSQLFRSDMGARACLGACAALFVVSMLLSGFFPIKLPDDAPARLGFFVAFGFGAGFSDKLFNDTLSKIIGSRAPRSKGDDA